MRFLLSILFLINIAYAEKVKLIVPDIACQVCVSAMNKSFENAVANPKKDVVVDLEKKTVTLNLKEKLTDEEIKKRVKSAGYTPASIIRQ